MSMQIIKRQEGQRAIIETIKRDAYAAPQISYSSEGRIAIRIPWPDGDVLVVLDRPLTRELIRFVKNGIQENPSTNTWCASCAAEISNDIPF